VGGHEKTGRLKTGIWDKSSFSYLQSSCLLLLFGCGFAALCSVRLNAFGCGSAALGLSWFQQRIFKPVEATQSHPKAIY
jgi:hypothetical protein